MDTEKLNFAVINILALLLAILIVIRVEFKKLQNENKAWKEYGQKHAVERGWSEAHELFKF